MPYEPCGFLNLFRCEFDVSTVCGTETEYDTESGTCVSTTDVTRDNSTVCGVGPPRGGGM